MSLTKERGMNFESFRRREILLPTERILHHALRSGETHPFLTPIEVIPAETPPTFSSPYYLANIGSPGNEELLELRFVMVPNVLPQIPEPEMGIALLMTNERSPRDISAMARQIRTRIADRGISFDSVIAPESLGSKLSQEIARQMGPDTLTTTLQKGKPQRNEQGTLFIGSPKPWIGSDHGIATASGTSHEGTQQKLFLDPQIAGIFRERSCGVLLVDDARLTKGTVDSSLRLLHQFDVPVAAVATVLNEAEPEEMIITERGEVPYIPLTKLPLFRRTADGMVPVAGTFTGVDRFYREQQTAD